MRERQEGLYKDHSRQWEEQGQNLKERTSLVSISYWEKASMAEHADPENKEKLSLAGVWL